jgi:hypothetical protein
LHYIGNILSELDWVDFFSTDFDLSGCASECKIERNAVALTEPEMFIVALEDDLPANTFNNDDFPAPDGPIIAQTSPTFTLVSEDSKSIKLE